jgi:hypothetical protein
MKARRLDRPRAGVVVRALRLITRRGSANPDRRLCRTPVGGLFAAPNGLRLSGDGGRAAGVRWSRGLGGKLIMPGALQKALRTHPGVTDLNLICDSAGSKTRAPRPRSPNLLRERPPPPPEEYRPTECMTGLRAKA